MSAGRVGLTIEGGIAAVTLERPEARNAMTWAMYGALGEACSAIRADPAVRVAVFRGAGGSFVAGTDIAQFTAFAGAEDGLAYERRIEAWMAEVETLPVPTIAAVEGAAMGGGLALAAACDFRVATPDARFGVPIARTVGNCLSAGNVARLVSALGVPRTKRLLLLAETIDAAEALAAGFVLRVADPGALDAEVGALCERLASHAPITMRASKELVRRVSAASFADDDLVAAAYGSDDFREGVAAFLAKRRPAWTGR